MKIEIKRFYPQDWGKYKVDLMQLEKAWEDNPELCFSEELKKELMTDPDGVYYIALDGDKVIGENYGQSLQSTDTDWFEGHYDPSTYRNYDKKTFYVTSIAILPEYNGMGIAKDMTYRMCKDLKKDGYKYITGHYNEGAMTNIIKFFNGETIDVCENWFDSDETHNFMEIDLDNIPKLLPVKRLKQLKDFDCAVASCAVLFGKDEVIDYGESYLSFGITPELGTSHEDLIQYALQVYGLRLSTRYNATIKDLIDRINEGNLVIVNYLCNDVDGEEDHYSVVYGYDKENIFLLNVWTGKEEKIPFETFESQWFSVMFGMKWMAWF
jgi:ribosomal protein S18 acetylase RimI-like enzyme